MLYLGNKSQISEGIEGMCKDYFDVTTMSIEEDHGFDGAQLQDIGVVMVNLMIPWDINKVLEETKKLDLPVVGVHTFNNEAIVNNYLEKGFYKYISLFELEENLESLSMELVS